MWEKAVVTSGIAGRSLAREPEIERVMSR